MSEKIELRGHLKFDPMTAHATLRVEPASDIVVEDSATPKFLLLKNGEFICWKSVFLVLQRRFKEGCAGRHEVRRGAWHGSTWPVRYYPASLPATAATQPARTVPWAAIPAPPSRPAAS